jgi:hypothetical protein
LGQAQTNGNRVSGGVNEFWGLSCFACLPAFEAPCEFIAQR